MGKEPSKLVPKKCSCLEVHTGKRRLDTLAQWFSTWDRLSFFEGSRELLIKMSIINSLFYISYMEPFFVIAKIIGSPGKMKAYFFIQNCFK